MKHLYVWAACAAVVAFVARFLTRESEREQDWAL